MQVRTKAIITAILACLALTLPLAAGRRALLQTFTPCSIGGPHSVTLETSQLAFANLTSGSLAFSCSSFSGYGRDCGSTSVYTNIAEGVGTPPYLPSSAAPRPFIEAYAHPPLVGSAVQPEIYYLDLLTGVIAVSPPAHDLANEGQAYPSYTQWPAQYDASGRPDNDGDVSGLSYKGTYAYYFNEIRAAVQNITSPPADSAFACNAPTSQLEPLLQYLTTIQGSTTLPLGTPLATGPLVAGEVPQWPV